MRWFVLLFAGCAGTTPGEDEPCVPGGKPTLEIGLGLDTVYAPLADGDEIPLIHGPQGGFHLEIGLLATHLDVSDLVTGHLEGEVDGVVLAEADPWLDLRCDAAHDALTSWGTLLIYDSTPAELDGQTTTIRATVTDASGVEVSASKRLVIRDAP